MRLTAEADQALESYGPLFRQILFNRGITGADQAQRFIRADFPPGNEAMSMLGIAQACDRIRFSIRTQEPVAIYGDYDADGVTATALLYLVLKGLGANVSGYIPNRFDEGYGLNKEALTSLSEAGVRLVITVDCGIRSVEEANFARSLGLDLIITDHHHPGKDVPQALAIINPKQAADPYPDKDLAGVGLAYKLASALIFSLGSRNLLAEDFLDLVAIGTVADMAPLVGENRALVRAGLDMLRHPRRQGILSLVLAAGLNPDRLTATDIGFMLGPRLNAAGRLESADAAFRLLTTDDFQTAGTLAQLLNTHNSERQKITKQIQAMAEQIALAGDRDLPLLFAAHPDFSPGVVGLAASRLSELYYRPAIVASIGDTFTRGSCRSIMEFHITQALDQCSDILEHHGGHAAAAGFTVRNERVPLLIERLQGIASTQLGHLDLRPSLFADVEVPLSDLSFDLLRLLSLLQPTGYHNPQARFVSRDVKVTRFRQVGKDGSHLKLTVTDGWVTFDAIAFRQGHWFGKMPASADLLYSFETNEYNGRQSLQLNVHDLKPAGSPD